MPWPRCGEIDVVENRGDPGWVSTHAPGPNLDEGKHHELERPATDWHVYAVTWGPDRLSWSIDGSVVQTMTKSEAGRGWVFRRPFVILLNLAVGGDWPGDPQPATRFPAEFRVDYVQGHDRYEPDGALADPVRWSCGSDGIKRRARRRGPWDRPIGSLHP